MIKSILLYVIENFLYLLLLVALIYWFIEFKKVSRTTNKSIKSRKKEFSLYLINADKIDKLIDDINKIRKDLNKIIESGKDCEDLSLINRNRICQIESTMEETGLSLLDQARINEIEKEQKIINKLISFKIKPETKENE